MKDKIYAELKKKYSDQLTSKFMESLSERLAESVKEESEIESVIDGLESSPISIKDVKSESTRYAHRMQQRVKELEALVQTQPPTPEPTLEQKPQTNPDYNALMQKIEILEKRESQREARAMLLERAKAKNIPAVLLDGIQVDSPDKVDETVNALYDKAQTLRQQMIQEGLVGEPPKKPSGGASSNQIADDIKNLSAKI